jgi:hypothetical protein
MLLAVALGVEEGSTEDGDLCIALHGELDVLSGVSEALAIPDEGACQTQLASGSTSNVVRQNTVVVADVGVEVDLGVDPLAVAVLETSSKHVAVVDADVLGSVVESHVDEHGSGVGKCVDVGVVE